MYTFDEQCPCKCSTFYCSTRYFKEKERSHRVLERNPKRAIWREVKENTHLSLLLKRGLGWQLEQAGELGEEPFFEIRLSIGDLLMNIINWRPQNDGHLKKTIVVAAVIQMSVSFIQAIEFEFKPLQMTSRNERK